MKGEFPFLRLDAVLLPDFSGFRVVFGALLLLTNFISSFLASLLSLDAIC